ncbi:response regulator [Alienimonas sp. DA493]|uniref:response regulator n=1 Tax=Alienimonas sp. DA493 TaxID=3373605 RepID=UPI0037551F43
MSLPPASPAPGTGTGAHEGAHTETAPNGASPDAPDRVPHGAPTNGAPTNGTPNAESRWISRALLVDDRDQARTRAAAELRRVLPQVKLEVAASRAEAVRLLNRFAPPPGVQAPDAQTPDAQTPDAQTPGAGWAPDARANPDVPPQADGPDPSGGRASRDGQKNHTSDQNPNQAADPGPFLFAVLRDGMAWDDGMQLPHAVRERLPDVPLILTCDPAWDEGPAEAQDPARAERVVRREGLEEAIPIAGDNVAAIAAAAEACLKLDRLAAERDRAEEERDRQAAARQAIEKKVDRLLRASAKSAEVEAGERRKLALVLHEDMLQLLVAARMFLACAQSSQEEPEGGPLAEIDTLLVRSVQLCKDLTGLWSPLVLYEAGLVAALRWLGETTRPPSDNPEADPAEGTPAGPIPGSLVAEVDCEDDAEPATQDGRTLLYQAAVELLSNVSRHAGVDRARLSLRRVRTGPDSPDMLSLTVSDEGRGFDAAPAAPSDGAAPDAGNGPAVDAVAGGTNFPASDRFGLFSLAERLRLAGGRMEIESVAGRGTTVRLLCPADAGRLAQRPLFADSDASSPSAEAPAAGASVPPADAAGVSLDPASQNEMLASAPPSESGPATDAEPPAPPVRVLLADDHRIIRMSLSGLLGRAAGVQVVGEAADGEEALQKAEELRPDVVLMDVNMPKLSGVEATRRLKAAQPETRVIALSMHESDDRELEMFEAGAECYVVKDGPPDQLLRAVLGKSAH